MNRKDFFKRFGLIAGAAVVAPSLIKAVVNEPENRCVMEGKILFDEDPDPPQFVVTTRPVLISDEQEKAGEIKIYVDTPLHLGDSVFLDPRHTNMDVPLTCLVVDCEAWKYPDYLGYTIMPLDSSARLVRSIRTRTPLFLGPHYQL